MKIAYVYDAVYPWVTGGIEKRVWELASRLADNHEVHWYGLHYWDGPPVYERDGVTLYGVASPLELYTEGRRSITEALYFSAALVRPLRRQRYDVIHCQEFPYFPCYPCKLYSTVRSSSLFMTWHEIWGDYWYEYLGRKGVFGKAVERTVAHLPDYHLAVSRRTKRDLEALGASDVTVVPNGITQSTIEGIDPSAETFDVLFVGRLIKEKNVDMLLRAVSRLTASEHDIRCAILGRGPEYEPLLHLVDELSLSENVEFLEPRETHEEVLRLMKGADVFAFPSRREGFGMTVLEALACGTPVVTINHPQNAARELVTDGKTGVVCDPTPSALADGIQRGRDTITPETCVAATQEYEWDTIVSQLEAVYRRGA